MVKWATSYNHFRETDFRSYVASLWSIYSVMVKVEVDQKLQVQKAIGMISFINIYIYKQMSQIFYY